LGYKSAYPSWLAKWEDADLVRDETHPHCLSTVHHSGGYIERGDHEFITGVVVIPGKSHVLSFSDGKTMWTEGNRRTLFSYAQCHDGHFDSRPAADSTSNVIE
jgi:hypothetical protein